jgi:hypothetical protein
MLRVRLPNLKWQVPARWIANAKPSRQILIWGALLGPGLVTSNPFATMWLVPIVLCLTGSTILGAEVGLIAGAVHGFARAAGILIAMRNPQCSLRPELLPLLTMRWRVIDGLALLFSAGALTSGLSLTR